MAVPKATETRCTDGSVARPSFRAGAREGETIFDLEKVSYNECAKF